MRTDIEQPGPYARLSISDVLKRLDRAPAPKRLSRPVDILVPVYRGRDYIAAFFQSLLASGLQDAAVIVVDDGNDDSDVAEYLQSDILQRPEVTILRKEQNEGFLPAICEAFDNRKYDSDVVILNMDTILPPNWLPRLMAPIQREENHIGSATPHTNSGTICSFPEIFQDNPPFLDLGINEIDSAFARVDAHGLALELPTGVGFCMGMSAGALSQIGFFDREAFGRGYGEENDWCLRARRVGFKNIIVPNLYIYHKRGGIFPAAEKQELVARHHRILMTRYPDYEAQVGEYGRADPLEALRIVISALLAGKKYGFDGPIRLSRSPPRNESERQSDLGRAPLSIYCDLSEPGRLDIRIHMGSRVHPYSGTYPEDLDLLRRAFNVRIDDRQG
jgi:GT2 family glycosyltransferase